MSEPIVVERRVAAPPSVVYEYFIDAEKWQRWQGVAASLEAIPGGLFTVTMANGMRSRGQFLELTENKRVIFTFGWIDHPGLPPGSSTVEIDLEPDGDGTMLRLTHRDLPPEEVPLHTEGWTHYVPRVATLAEGGDPGPDPGLG